MVERISNVPVSPSPLSLEDPVLAVDRKLATRRTGLRDKGEEAHVVLAGIGVERVGDLLRHYPRRYIDRSAVERIGDLRIGQRATVLARVHKTVKRLTRNPVGVQIGHAGRKASSQVPWEGREYLSAEQSPWQTVAPSALLARGTGAPLGHGCRR